MQKNKSSILWVIFGFLISILAIYLAARNVDTIENLIISAGIFGPLVGILIYGLLSVTPVPSDAVTLINGALYGPLIGGLISWWGNNFAAVIEYFLGRWIRSATNFEEIKKKLPFGVGKLPVNSVGFLLFGRFVPQVGGKMVSIIGGIYKVPFWRYFWTAALSNFLGSILFALGGWGILKFLVR